MIPETTIQELKDINPINIISQYVKLKRSGSEYVGLCPFHDEKTPSFYVHQMKGYYCHGCNARGGNVIDFIMAYEGKTFMDAVEQLAGMTGIMINSNVPAIKPKIKPIQSIKPLPIDIIPDELVSQNLAVYKRNNLYQFLLLVFGKDEASKLCEQYGIGSSKYYGKGTTLFIQRDVSGKIRQVKVMLYNPVTGKRRKEKQFEPKIIGRNLTGYDANLTQCFFGEHLLNENDSKPIAIVESEKTAAICSIHYPKYLWIATGGKNGCSMVRPEVNRPLHGRSIHLFPDVDAVNEWHKVAYELRKQGFKVFVNDVMASYSQMVGSKADIADLILESKRVVPASPATKYEYIHLVELTDNFIYLFDQFPQLKEPLSLNGKNIENSYKWVCEAISTLTDHLPSSGLTKDLSIEYQAVYVELIALKELMFRITQPLAIKRFSKHKTIAA